MQLRFFLTADDEMGAEVNSRISRIKGLTYIPNYLSPCEHDSLLSILDYSSDWSNELKRRVQHYGYKYDYAARSVDTSMRIGDLPGWCADLSNRFLKEGLAEELPDQVIVNEYLPGQGIGKHIDCEPCFTGTIISLSLGSDCIMDFTHRMTGEAISILLEARSLIVFKEDARYMWYHGIAPRKADRINGVVIERKKRVSLTFRKVILQATEA